MDNGDQNTGANDGHDETAPKAKGGIGNQQIQDQSANKSPNKSNNEVPKKPKTFAWHDDACYPSSDKAKDEPGKNSPRL
jgi:hypothetical protein